MNEITALIGEAEEGLKATEELLSAGRYAFAISTAYYVMFYCARALLPSKGTTPKRHAGVHATEILKFTESCLGV